MALFCSASREGSPGYTTPILQLSLVYARHLVVLAVVSGDDRDILGAAFSGCDSFFVRVGVAVLQVFLRRAGVSARFSISRERWYDSRCQQTAMRQCAVVWLPLPSRGGTVTLQIEFH